MNDKMMNSKLCKKRNIFKDLQLHQKNKISLNLRLNNHLQEIHKNFNSKMYIVMDIMIFIIRNLYHKFHKGPKYWEKIRLNLMRLIYKYHQLIDPKYFKFNNNLQHIIMNNYTQERDLKIMKK